MSCGTSCPCQLSSMMDTQGSKRDPVSSEKAWLDFAVRYLSREAVCKGKGQEAVWSSKCKPSWWDSMVCLPWKNPTANPKDTKEVLMKKYEVLSEQLRQEGRFPKEMEEEATLWAAGKYKELFLLTSLSSVTGKASSLHAAVMETITKADEMKAEVNQAWVKDIQKCLGATLKAVENLSTKSSRRGTKRPSSETGKENMIGNNSSKKCRLVNDKPLNRTPISEVVSILPKQNVSESKRGPNPPTPSPDHTRDIMIQLQKVLKKRKELSVANHDSSLPKSLSLNKKPPVPVKRVNSARAISSKTKHNHDQGMSEPVQVSLSPIPVFVNNTVSPNSPSQIMVMTTPDNPFFVSQADISITHIVPLDSKSANSETSLPIGDQSMSCSKNTNQYRDTLYDISTETASVSSGSMFNSSEKNFLLSSFDQDNMKEGPIDFLIQSENDVNSVNTHTIVDEIGFDYNVANRSHGGRAPSNSSSHDSGESSDGNCSDSGCISDSSFVDSILSPEEQNQIWLDDDIDGVLSNITVNDSSKSCHTSDEITSIEFSLDDLENFVKDI